MKHAQQRRRDTLNQPTDWGVLVDHTPGRIPRILNMDAVLQFKEILLASHKASKRRAKCGGLARATTFRDQKEQAKKRAGEIWSAQSDLSCRAVALTIAQRAGHSVRPRTIRRWIAPFRPSTK